MKQVSKAEFDAFTSGYGKPLRRSVIRICEPAELWVHDDSIQSSYAAASIDKEVDTRVAKIVYDWLGPNGEVDHEEPGKFYRYYVKAQAGEGAK